MSSANSLFMQIDGIKGTVTDSKYSDWIAVNHISNGVFQSAHIDNTKKNLIKDGAHFDSVSFSKEFDSTSTELFMAVVEGTVIKQIIIAVGVTVDAKNEELARWTYKDCVLTMSNTSIQGSGSNINEGLSFVYSSVEYQTEFTDSTNKKAKQGPVHWDLIKNTK